jgi:hypothetical protein
MKLDKRIKQTLVPGLAMTTLATASPLMAHPEGAHQAATASAHGLAHALINLPVAASAGVAVTVAVWMLISLKRGRTSDPVSCRAPELKRE